MTPYNDFQPLDGEVPSRAMAKFMAADNTGAPAVITQHLGDFEASPKTEAPTSGACSARTFLFASVPLDVSPSREYPYGPDFTSDAFCGWDAWQAQMSRQFGELGVNGDTLLAFADHRHRCKVCRERVAAIVQDLEGELGA